MSSSGYVHVKYNEHKGQDFKVGNGARQGGILSPLIFNFYVTDMINEILKMSVGCRLGGEATNILCYADIILLSPSATGLQMMIDKLAVLIEDFCLSINLEKSIHIIFTFCNLYKVTGPKVLMVLIWNVFKN